MENQIHNHGALEKGPIQTTEEKAGCEYEVQVASSRSSLNRRSSSRSETPKNADASEPKETEPLNLGTILKRVRLSTWWAIGLILLAVPLIVALMLEKRWTHSLPVSLSGIFLFAEIAWSILWISRGIVRAFGSLWQALLEHLALEDLEAYTYLFHQVDISFGLFVTTLICWPISRSDIICFQKDGVCAAKWVGILRHLVLATLIVTLAFFIKAVILEIALVRSALSELWSKFQRVRQVLDAAEWVMNNLDPEGSDEASGGEETSSWRNPRELIHRRLKGRSLISFLLLRTVEDDEDDEDDDGVDDSGEPEQNHVEVDVKDLRDKYFKRKARKRRRGLSPDDFMKLIDANGDNKITASECNRFLRQEVNPYLNEVVSGIDGVRKAKNDVDVVLSILLLGASALIYAAFFVKDFSSYTTLIWTSFTGLSFALAPTITEFIASCFFVFCKQPYAVGDRVTIDGKDLLVDAVHLNFSKFHRVEDNVVEQINTSRLLDIWIANRSRTKSRCSTETHSLPAKIEFTDEQMEKAMADILEENKLCHRHLKDYSRDPNRSGLAFVDRVKKDEAWVVTLRYSYREKLIYRETLMAQCGESVQRGLPKLLEEIQATEAPQP